MNCLNRSVAMLGATFILSSCSVPPVMIPANASCEELLFLYDQQPKSAAIHPLTAISQRGQLDRIEAVLTAKGCLMPADPSSNNASPSSAPTLLEDAATALHSAAPDELTRFMVSGEALGEAASSQWKAFNAAGLALFIAAPIEFVINDAAWKALYNAAPRESSAVISAEHKALYANMAPDQHADSTSLGKDLRSAAPKEFAAYNSAWQALRNGAPIEFSAYASAYKVLYAAASVQLTRMEEAGLALYATAPNEFTILKYAGLHADTIEALREAAPLEFSAYASATPGTAALDQAFHSLDAAAPKEFMALRTAFDTIENLKSSR